MKKKIRKNSIYGEMANKEHKKESMLYVISGQSGSGKDTILQKIVNLTDIRQIVRYTDRPIRPGELDGREYHFLSKEEMQTKIDHDEFTVLETFDTAHGIWNYGTSLKELLYTNRSYITTVSLHDSPELLRWLIKNSVPYRWCYLSVNDQIRATRLFARELMKEPLDFMEFARRWSSDREDDATFFSAFENIVGPMNICNTFFSISNDTSLSDTLSAIFQVFIREEDYPKVMPDMV